MWKSMRDVNTHTLPHAAPELSYVPPEQCSPVLLPQAVSDNPILVVAANPELRQLLAEILQEAGYTVLVADNDRAALAMMATWTVDLVLLDVVRSDVDAVATLTAIRQQSLVPVIIFSAEYSATLYTQHKPLEIAAYLPKPFQLQQLLDAVQLVLQGRNLAR
jgi:DNA-binding response OmpR family regulator